MARFRIEATWGERAGAPVVELEYARLEPLGGQESWRVLGQESVTDLALMTMGRIRDTALASLAMHGMAADDSFELYSWVQADRELLEAVGAA